MKTLKQIFFLTALFCASLATVSCDSEDPVPVNPVLSKSEIVLKPSSSAEISISGGTAPYTASSSATSVATATVSGSTLTINAVSLGNTTVTVATADYGSATLKVSVSELELSQTTLSLALNASGSVTAGGGTAPYTANSLTEGVTASVSGNNINVQSSDYEGIAEVSVVSSEGLEALLQVNVSSPIDPILFVNNTQIGNGDQQFEIKRNIKLMKGVYLMKGWVYITDGFSLTLAAGTVIKGDKATKAALIVEPGGKLFAEGTQNAPIVLTSAQAKGSRKPGDWGGLIICGKARNNNGTMAIEGGPRTIHGGNNDEDNSGVFKYMRIEFAGFPLQRDQEINGITFGSVGRGTKVENIQVSYTNDDSFEWFGGSVNCKRLIAFHGWDDDFDTDNGFSGKLQYLLAVRNPKIADVSRSNGFESDNNKDGTEVTPHTGCVFSNVTFVGPMGQDPAFANTTDYINGGVYYPDNGSNLGTFQAAMQIRRYSRLSCFNSVAIGYPVGLILDNDKGNSQSMATSGELVIDNVYFAGMNKLGSDKNGSLNDYYSTNGKDEDPDRESFSSTYFKSRTGNVNLPNIADLKLKQPNSLADDANYGPSQGSPLTGKNSADLFANPKVANGFDKVDYIGAFKSEAEADNWTKGWTNFDPQNTEY
ncbi:MAG: hypothetical protein LBC98_00710 [Prevotellaceae bacterium]|jgi:hypothetical protein|nr:hypothetical protein [Prevotellaceae bacterium]